MPHKCQKKCGTVRIFVSVFKPDSFFFGTGAFAGESFLVVFRLVIMGVGRILHAPALQILQDGDQFLTLLGQRVLDADDLLIVIDFADDHAFAFQLVQIG